MLKYCESMALRPTWVAEQTNTPTKEKLKSGRRLSLFFYDRARQKDIAAPEARGIK